MQRGRPYPRYKHIFWKGGIGVLDLDKGELDASIREVVHQFGQFSVCRVGEQTSWTRQLQRHAYHQCFAPSGHSLCHYLAEKHLPEEQIQKRRPIARMLAKHQAVEVHRQQPDSCSLSKGRWWRYLAWPWHWRCSREVVPKRLEDRNERQSIMAPS